MWHSRATRATQTHHEFSNQLLYDVQILLRGNSDYVLGLPGEGRMIHPGCGRACEVYARDFDRGELFITPRGQEIIDEEEIPQEVIERGMYASFGIRVDN